MELFVYMKKTRENLKGVLRVINDHAFYLLEKNTVVQILDVTISKVLVKSLKTGETFWLWQDDIIYHSDLIERGL